MLIGGCGVATESGHRGSGRSRPGATKRAAVLLGATLLGGCSLDNMGVMVSDVFAADGATVISIQIVGTQLRTRAEDGGLTLGYGRRVYIYPDSLPQPLKPGRYYFHAPLPDEAPVAMDARTIGLDLRRSSVEIALTLGLRQITVMAQVPENRSVMFDLAFAPDDPAATRLRQ